mmetsp:Transcript_5749/g.7887  ORF Transcript_5749/g.7887 Transcript_5749/m.7887 type:complete len:1068 (-) Transcript_5749:198-3401(-)
MAAPTHSQLYAQQSVSNNNGGGSVKMVAGYALQQRLGSGSFAVVYKGVKVIDSEGQTETVAIKAIARTGDKLTKKVLENLDQEISILRTYQHPNIVCLHDVQKTERHFYLILEYCGGGDVQRLIRTRKSGRLSERLTRRLMRDLSAGLKFLWGQELIHRDIKPQNLLLTGPLPLDELEDISRLEEDEKIRRQVNFPSSRFSLKIADFGFARHLQTASLAETLCGSPLYMAPEILQHHRYDAKADLWSAGTVLFEMIAGRPPFNGENHIDLLRNIQRKAVRLPGDVKVSKECVNLLRLCLNRNPLSRAGFKEFFTASDAFVGLGCNGSAAATAHEQDLCRHKPDLGPIAEVGESSVHGAASMATIATGAPQTEHNNDVPKAAPTTQIELRPLLHANENQNGPQKLIKNRTTNTIQPLPPHENDNMPAAHPASVNVKPVAPASCPATSSPVTYSPTPQTTTPNHLIQNSGQIQHQQAINTNRQQSHFVPLQPSPPGPKSIPMSVLPPLSLDNAPIRMRNGTAYVQPSILSKYENTSHTNNLRRSPGSSQSSGEESEFVMVEHGGTSNQSSPTPTIPQQQQQKYQRQTPTQIWKQSPPNQLYAKGVMNAPLPPSPPVSPGFFRKPVISARGIGVSTAVNAPVGRDLRGMLSTSPGTGGAIVGMMGTSQGAIDPNQRMCGLLPPRNGGCDSSNVEFEAKMLAAAEDVGRRAVNVAHLGDTRAYLAMRLAMMNEGSSSLLSSGPMEGVVEEGDSESSSGTESAETSLSSCTPVKATTRKRTVSIDHGNDSRIKKQMDEEEEDEEMPFAVSPAESEQNLMLAPSSTRTHPSTVSNSGSTTTSSRNSRVCPTVIQAHFGEALSCYLKALSMMKASVNAIQKVMNELGVEKAASQSIMNNPKIMLRKRCEVSLNWLSGQFSGVLERADAANVEVAKIQEALAQHQRETGEPTGINADKKVTMVGVEELIYNHALSCGRDGAVKQLLGQLDAARACYRSAGLLAETLLMEPKLGEDDREVLEGYVHGFAERITELDSIVIQQNSQGGASNCGLVGDKGLRRGSTVVGLIGGVTPPS